MFPIVDHCLIGEPYLNNKCIVSSRDYNRHMHERNVHWEYNYIPLKHILTLRLCIQGFLSSLMEL